MKLQLILNITYEPGSVKDEALLKEQVKRKILYEVEQGMLSDYDRLAVVEEVELILRTR
jgi:hypothetical protein